MKKFFSIIITLTLILGISKPIYALTSENAANNILKLTLDDCYKYLETNNKELLLMDEKIRILDRQYKESLDKAEDGRIKTSGTDFPEMNYKKDELLNWKRKLLELDNAKGDKSDRLENLKESVQNQYIGALQIQSDKESIQKEIDSLEKKIEQFNLRIRLGQIKNSDVNPLKIQKSQLVSQLNMKSKELNLALLSLKQNLYIDLGKEIYLEPVKLDYIKFNDVNIEKRISDAVDKSSSLAKQNKDLELAKLEYDIVVKYGDDDKDDDYDVPPEALDIEVSIKDKEIKLADARTNHETSLWTSYYNLKNLEDNVEIERLNLESAEITFNLTQVKVKTGLATGLDESNDRIALDKQKNVLQKIINQYVLQSQIFENSLNS
jgi:hypothetical protein